MRADGCDQVADAQISWRGYVRKAMDTAKGLVESRQCTCELVGELDSRGDPLGDALGDVLKCL